MKRLFVRQCQNLDVKKINWWPARSHPVMQAFASLPSLLPPPPDSPFAVSSVSELCLEMGLNIFGREALLAEKPNDDSLIGLHPLNEKLSADGPHDNNSKRSADVMPL
jgi:hypothetical protein